LGGNRPLPAHYRREEKLPSIKRVKDISCEVQRDKNEAFRMTAAMRIKIVSFFAVAFQMVIFRGKKTKMKFFHKQRIPFQPELTIVGVKMLFISV